MEYGVGEHMSVTGSRRGCTRKGGIFKCDSIRSDRPAKKSKMFVVG